MHDARKKLDARWSMPDARSLKVDRRCPMHGEVWMLDGRCTIFESRSSMHTKLQLFHAINGKQNVSNNHHFEWAENIIVDGKGKDETMFKQSLKGFWDLIFTQKRTYDVAQKQLRWLSLDEKRYMTRQKTLFFRLNFHPKKNIWHSEKHLRRKNIYDMVKNAFDEKRYITGEKKEKKNSVDYLWTKKE